ncbi:hypothetical protein AYI69_g5123 [Smittium culicis]|uniref:Uncharacterized protein n=1 Tax=Smittium culicis TaxID=133412 RepID=A0A1R1Y8T6_9FUNG|nr:hypothetical protein AYI69_g5123 [Smittium culicis]
MHRGHCGTRHVRLLAATARLMPRFHRSRRRRRSRNDERRGRSDGGHGSRCGARGFRPQPAGGSRAARERRDPLLDLADLGVELVLENGVDAAAAQHGCAVRAAEQRHVPVARRCRNVLAQHKLA